MKKYLSGWGACAIGLSALFLSGCSIICAARLPIQRDPTRLSEGKPQKWVDNRYGFPIAVGLHENRHEYVEEIQFINGTPLGWKIARICIHSIGDWLTLCLWEFIGFPIELCNSDYPEYIYFIVYDDQNRIVRAVSENSPEGQTLSRLPWVSPRVDSKLYPFRGRVNRLSPEKRKMVRSLVMP